MTRRTLLASAAALAAAAAPGCGPGADLRGVRSDVRTGEVTLERALHRAFERQYAAAFRMRAGRANRDVVRYVNVQCLPRGPQPGSEALPWPWRCRVRWFLQGGSRVQVARYEVGVDARGCFEARSAAFPLRILERVLDRTAPNPLSRFRSCP